MENSCIQLDELPNEILMIIFKKLCSIDILYSLLGVNKRLNKIVYDYVFTSCVTLTTRSTNDLYYPLNNPMLDRFCLQILPKIHDKIKWINVESSSMERILLSTNYPNLNGLGLYDLEIEIAEHLFTEETSLMDIFKNQISSLVIDIAKDEKHNTRNDVLELIFTRILSMFTNLQCLNFGPSFSCCQILSFDISCSTIFSSTILELHINLRGILDCLYLLDGHFNQLHTLHVNIYYINSSNWLSMYNKGKLPNLRCFSLHSKMETNIYDEIIVSFLHRMSNLEKLDLHLVVCRKTFIDGNELKRNINNYTTRLKKFAFNIYSNIRDYDALDLTSNEDIQHTFRTFKDYQIISTVDYFPKEKRGQCHIYSYPYNLKHYKNITNNFPGGLFEYVSEISLFDEHPFEHEFFR
ncbi:unnamed protein product [Rotaria sp. Silwood2]|nr:unnamed protein product [Rotaria sp. Silwood2]